MNFTRLLLILTSICLLHFTVLAQEGGEEFKRHKVLMSLSHTHVPAGVDVDGKKNWITLPSVGLDYDFRITERWGIGLHTDMVVENFKYESEESAVYERSRPIALVLVGSHRFGEHLMLIAGGGIELAKEENFSLIRLGLDYGWELPKEWELAVSLMNDFKIDAYDSWVLGLGVGKSF